MPVVDPLFATWVPDPNWDKLLFYQFTPNTKVLRDRKRHTARIVASPGLGTGPVTGLGGSPAPLAGPGTGPVTGLGVPCEQRDTCENITSRRTMYAGGKNIQKCKKKVPGG